MASSVLLPILVRRLRRERREQLLAIPPDYLDHLGVGPGDYLEIQPRSNRALLICSIRPLSAKGVSKAQDGADRSPDATPEVI